MLKFSPICDGSILSLLSLFRSSGSFQFELASFLSGGKCAHSLHRFQFEGSQLQFRSPMVRQSLTGLRSPDEQEKTVWLLAYNEWTACARAEESLKATQLSQNSWALTKSKSCFCELHFRSTRFSCINQSKSFMLLFGPPVYIVLYVSMWDSLERYPRRS